MKGDWLLPGALDKPPLTIYISAISMALVGVTALPDGTLTLTPRAGELAARMPGVFASLLTVSVIAALAKSLYNNAVGTRHASSLQLPMVTLLAALSPFAIAFSATAFTDGLLLLFLLLALWQMSARRPLWAGIWLALAFACKQQAALYVPLLVLMGWAADLTVRHSPFARQGEGDRQRFWGTRYSISLLPLALMIIALIVWDAARSPPVSLWALAAANNDPGRLIRADEVLPRLLVWLQQAKGFAGYGWITALLGGFAVLALLWRMVRQPRQHSTLVDVLLATYLLIYGLLHWLVAFNTYDRYLLPVLPLALLLAGRGIDWLLKILWARRAVFLLVISIVLIFPALDAANGRLPIGGRQADYAGIDTLAAHLNARPLGAIIYDHWLGWELDYYLGAWTDKRRVYYPTPAALAAGALAQADPAPRYFVVPSEQPVRPWLNALLAAGFEISLDWDDGRYSVYRLIRRQAGAGA